MAYPTRFFLTRVDENETEFLPEHEHSDLRVLGFEYRRRETELPSLVVEVENPFIGAFPSFLAPGQKRWAWFWCDYDGTALPLFFGVVTGVPSSIIRKVVTIEFSARPIDYNAQKATLAYYKKVLPYWDPVFYDKQRRDQPDLALSGYSEVWHVDPITHEVTTTDVLIGEDGVVEFNEEDHVFDGLDVDMSSVPISRVEVDAEFSWTQIGRGEVDLTQYIKSNWPNEQSGFDAITSFTLSDQNWLKAGASIGDGWKVASASAIPLHDFVVRSKISGGTTVVNWGELTGGGSTNVQSRLDEQYISNSVYGSIEGEFWLTDYSYDVTFDSDVENVTSWNTNASWVKYIIPMYAFVPTLVVAYDAKRPRIERLRFTLTAQMQSIITDPGDSEIETVTMKTQNLSEEVETSEDSEPEIPIGDPRRRSYICTNRGHYSIEHLILVARAHLLLKSRAVAVVFRPHRFEQMLELSLRKNALVHDSRLPYGEALGKITEITISLDRRTDGGGGTLTCFCTIECAVGRGGAVAYSQGEPAYVDAAVMGPDLQEFVGSTVLVDTSVGYQPPPFEPNDDGLDLHGAVDAVNVIEQGLTVEWPPAEQRTFLEGVPLTATLLMPGTGILTNPTGSLSDQVAAAQQAVQEAVSQRLQQAGTVARFKLKSMTRSFESVHDLQVTELRVPAMMDLEGINQET